MAWLQPIAQTVLARDRRIKRIRIPRRYNGMKDVPNRFTIRSRSFTYSQHSGSAAASSDLLTPAAQEPCSGLISPEMRTKRAQRCFELCLQGRVRSNVAV